MKYLLIPLACTLAATKLLIQSRFAKNMAKKPMDAILFNGLIFGFGALMLSYRLIGGEVAASAIIAGLVVGMANLIFQMGYVFAFSCGPVSLTTLIATTSMIVPILMSAIIYDEPLTGNRILGLVITISALYFTTERANKDKIRLRWGLFTLMAFVGNCCVSMTQKIYTKSFAQGDTSSFVAIHFAFSAVIALTLYAIFHSKGMKCSYKVDRKVILTAAVIGIILGGFHLVYTYALSVIDATILLPLYNGGTTLLVTLGSAFFMKEKLTPRQYISVILGIIAIALMSI